MTIEDLIDHLELSLVVWVSDFCCGAPGGYRRPSEEDMKRKIMRIVGAHQGALYVVLRKAEK